MYECVQALCEQGYPVDAIAPMAAMYLTLRFSLKGKKVKGKEIVSTDDMSQFLLEHASLAIVPFAAFGADKESEWYRLSVGTCQLDGIPAMLQKLKNALDELTD